MDPENRRIRVGINGYPGRIAKCVVRQVAGDLCIGARDNIELVAINAPGKDEKYLLNCTQRDSVHGRFGMPFAQQRPDLETWVEDRVLHIGGSGLNILDNREAPDWGSLGVDIVLDCTGKFSNSQKAAAHRARGAKKVIISAPPKDGDVDRIAIWGVNSTDLGVYTNHIYSAASCTTTALSPLCMALELAGIGIKLGWMTTFHSVTASNNAVDGADIKDWNRGRSSLVNVYPTKTGAAKMIGKVIPSLNGRLTGTAMRGPWVNGSLLQLSFIPMRRVTVEEIQQAFRAFAAANPAMMGLANCPTVSTDILTLPHFVIADLVNITVQDEADGTQLVTVMGWYDNEWGYSEAAVLLLNELAGQMLAAK